MEWQAEERNSLNMQSVLLLKFQMNTSVIILSSYKNRYKNTSSEDLKPSTVYHPHDNGSNHSSNEFNVTISQEIKLALGYSIFTIVMMCN